jgi:hypothetical protein
LQWLTVLLLLGAGQSQQLSGLSSLVVNLKSCLEIMNQKREEMAVAFAACEGLDLDIKQATDFCQDAIELESSIYVRWLCCSYLFVAWQRELTAFLCGCCRRARGDSLRTSASSS